MRTWPGWASPGRRPVRRQSEHMADYQRRARAPARTTASSTAASGPAPRCWPRSPARRTARPRPSSAPPLPAAEEVGALAAASLSPGGCRWPRRARRWVRRSMRSRSSRRARVPRGERGPDRRPRRARPATSIVARKDVGVAYHLAVVVDDALQGVTAGRPGRRPVRGDPVQRLLQALLGLPDAGLSPPPTARWPGRQTLRQARPRRDAARHPGARAQRGGAPRRARVR